MTIEDLEAFRTEFLEDIQKLLYGSGISSRVRKEQLKVLCNLSTDQTGLILRAADESRVLTARSMNTVFKAIVPYLSTPHKKSLSYDSMRSKSYMAEERDKEVAIQTLEKIIEKIKRY